MKILYVSLDERPCNYKYPQEIIENSREVTLVVPPKEFLNKKKITAPLNKLWKFVEENIIDCDYAILSMDMMIYGGLLPSRLHKMTEAELLENVEKVKRLKAINPKIKIYGFDTIMRVPNYNSAEEEPDYYNEYGTKIFKISWLRDKILKCHQSEEEEREFELIKKEVPKEYQEDYFGRRNKNFNVTTKLLELVQDGTLEFFVIPQDDTALYGVQVEEQQQHIKKIKDLDIIDKVFIYPGADEVGCTLLSRVINNHKGKTPSVFIRFSSLNGPFIVPKYEDRPYLETIKWHIISCGLWIVDNSREADIVLMVNTPGKEMREAKEQHNNFRENNSMRNLMEFVLAAKEYVKQDKKVIFADVAYSNGSDIELIKLIGKIGIMSSLYGYSGWNTNGNTLGTVLCSGTCGCYFGQNKKFLIYRFLEDCGYQAMARQIVISELSQMDISYYDFKDKEIWVQERVDFYLNEFIKDSVQPYFQEKINLTNVSFPWRRMFEVDISIDINIEV